MRKLPLLVIAYVMLSASSCTDGYYRPVAEAKCRDRGLAPGTEEFWRCVRDVEEVEYRYWTERLKTVGD